MEEIILADKGNVVQVLNNGLAFFIGLGAFATVLILWLRYSERNGLSTSDYLVIMIILAGSALWLFLVARS